MRLPLIISFFIHFLLIQTKNPCLDITLWDQPRNLLGIGINGAYPVFLQRLGDLPQSFLNRTGVRVYHHDQCCSSPGLTASILAYLRGNLSPHPMFSTSCTHLG